MGTRCTRKTLFTQLVSARAQKCVMYFDNWINFFYIYSQEVAQNNKKETTFFTCNTQCPFLTKWVTLGLCSKSLRSLGASLIVDPRLRAYLVFKLSRSSLVLSASECPFKIIMQTQTLHITRSTAAARQRWVSSSYILSSLFSSLYFNLVSLILALFPTRMIEYYCLSYHCCILTRDRAIRCLSFLINTPCQTF